MFRTLTVTPPTHTHIYMRYIYTIQQTTDPLRSYRFYFPFPQRIFSFFFSEGWYSSWYLRLFTKIYSRMPLYSLKSTIFVNYFLVDLYCIKALSGVSVESVTDLFILMYSGILSVATIFRLKVILDRVVCRVTHLIRLLCG